MIPFIDMTAIRNAAGAALTARLDAVLASGNFILGPEVAELEQRLAEFSGAAAAVGVASGTDALKIALMANEIGPHDAVFIPAFTFAATAEAVVSTGATPMFIDVALPHMTMDPVHLREKIATVRREGVLRAAAVITVDLFGLPARYEEIATLAAEEDILLIADGAQSFGGQIGTSRVGTLAPITAISFYPTKPLGCFGDGGAILTTDSGMAAKFRELRHHGFDAARENIVQPGMNSRLDTIQAAILLARFDLFVDELARRDTIAGWYGEFLDGAVEVPDIPTGRKSAWAVYTVRSAHRDALRTRLSASGIGTAIYYATPVCDFEAYRRFRRDDDELPRSRQLCAEVLSLPMHPYLDRSTVEQVCSEVRQALR
ncbi:MAG: aminotransferase class I/II-fold pyridoxal phosphate-dependent enzyme [Alphaproteobacteria bacterium]|nr:aminotransferase class I/II-fold pyridoxal phosphate-dependent enzyme [Alphaproteobacteria bacterium]